MRRIVITGIGIVSPLKCGNDLVWKALLKGESGIRQWVDTRIDQSNKIPVSVAAQVPIGKEIGQFDYSRVSNKETAQFAQFALYASEIALTHSNLGGEQLQRIDLNRAGVAIASGIGTIDDITSNYETFKGSYRKLRSVVRS